MVFQRPAVLPDGELLSICQAARALGTAPSTLHRWVNDGFIAAEQTTRGAPWRIRITDSLRRRFVEHPPEGYVVMQEATRLLGVSRQTVLQRVKRGELDVRNCRKISLWSKNTEPFRVWAKVWAGIFFRNTETKNTLIIMALMYMYGGAIDANTMWLTGTMRGLLQAIGKTLKRTRAGFRRASFKPLALGGAAPQLPSLATLTLNVCQPEVGSQKLR
ncbi:helix-turn-helix domain-containing protein [Pseudomonas aeruginosa]